MKSLPTIPRDTVIAALRQLLGDDVDDILGVTIQPDVIDVIRATDKPYMPRILVVDECSSCHTPKGRPCTDYCQRGDSENRGPDVRHHVTEEHPTRHIDQCGRTTLNAAPAVPGERHLCTLKLDDHQQMHTDGHRPVHICGCGYTWPVGDPTPWVDNGCRCPNPDHEHLPGCPTIADLQAKTDNLEQQVQAAAVRAHERDHEVEDTKGVTWHQTGPHEAHERWRCEPSKCGWDPLQP